MLRLVQKNRGTLGVVDGKSKEIWIKCNYLEGKIGRSVRTFFVDRCIEPVVVRSKNRDMSEKKRFSGEAGPVEMLDGGIDNATLIAINRIS
jgi:hypothetical protein